MNESKVLHNWKWALYIFCVFLTLDGALSGALSLFGVADIDVMDSLRNISAALIQFFVVRHFAYTKRGVKLIGFIVITFPIRLVSQGALVLSMARDYDLIASIICTLLVSLYYWWNCLQLFRVNLQRKRMVAAKS